MGGGGQVDRSGDERRTGHQRLGIRMEKRWEKDRKSTRRENDRRCRERTNLRREGDRMRQEITKAGATRDVGTEKRHNDREKEQ